MSRQMQKLKKRIGLAPGSLVHIGSRKVDRIRIRLIDYAKQNIIEKEISEISQSFDYLGTENVSWINIDGLHDLDLFSTLGSKLELHPLILEDILDTSQYPKLEIDKEHLVIILKMLSWNAAESRIEFEQVSFVLGDNYLISFQEREGDIFEPVRQRLRLTESRIRRLKTDYLLYSLLDAVIDNYFILLGKMGEKMDSMEENVMTETGEDILNNIHRFKRDVIFLRKSGWHLRQVISKLNRDDFPQISAEVSNYLRDLNDNIIQVIDTIETYRETTSGLLDLYLSSLSNRMNQVMKVLTIFAAIFIPLTFLAGVYGMNFHHIPELSWKYAYPVWWAVTIIIAVIMLLFFKKNKWL